MRSRIERRLRRRELRFRWEVTDLPPTPKLGPVQYLHILRVLQEAISNAIRHAEPSVITLTTETRCNESGREGIAIRIADNGAGASEIYEPGYGIENMRHRAAQLDGRLEFARGSEGTTVELWFPIGSKEQTTSSD
jgi:signal transduction histidine kinase